ncbi:MAG TPA: hypothetical protein VN577_13360 [Terriglobales bacterium]|nr:hypothetical protein [Terriglobales bacterium]
MGRVFLIVMVAVTVLLFAVGTLTAGKAEVDTSTPDGAVRTFYDYVKAKDWKAAYNLVNNQNKVDLTSLVKELNGNNGDLRSFSTLSKATPKVLKENDTQALVRTDLQWSTAVGAMYESKDLNLVKSGGGWKLDWPVTVQAKVPPQVIPVNFLRWDIVTRGADDDWGAQNVEAPRVRIVSMNAVERDNATIILGEIVNEDTVPGFVAVNATLVGKNGQTLGEESSFDKISHVLLPKEVSPFRVDFPGIKLADVKNVRMQPNALLVPASADPTIGVLNQKLDTDSNGRKVLRGELINESGQTVNIPHVLATFYDNQGRVIWVSDGYVDRALLPQSPEPFTLGMRDDIADKVQTYRVTVNSYSINKTQL